MLLYLFILTFVFVSFFFFFKQKTAYEMRISDWSSDVCSSDLRLFRWRGHEGDPEVVTFRIARNYEIAELTLEHVLASLKDLPEGVRHTMCFVGVGDHGGGPTERQIQWCRDHADRIPGCRDRKSTRLNSSH